MRAQLGRMCSPQSSNMDDVNRLLHPCASSLCSRAVRHSGVQILTLGRLDSTGGLVDANRVSLSAEKIQQFPLLTVAESTRGQTNWGLYDISFQLSVSLMTLLPADCCCKEKDCPTKGALPRLNEHALSLLESSKRRQR